MRSSTIQFEAVRNPYTGTINEKAHCLLGISPFNSYFIEDNLLILFKWAFNFFNEVSIFLPDEISVHTLQAIGYKYPKAIHKTNRQDRYLKNKVIRSLNKLNIQPDLIDKSIITLSNLKNNSNYKRIYQDFLYKFDHVSSFRDGCLTTAEWILSNYISDQQITFDKKYEAVKYFLAEMPLFANTPMILNVPYSSMIYQSIPNYLKQMFCENKYIAPNQNFIIAKIV